MTVFETLFVMISFSTLIVVVMSEKKNNHPISLAAFRVIYIIVLHYNKYVYAPWLSHHLIMVPVSR